MFCPDKILKADGGQLFPDARDIDAQGIVVHIELIVPEEIHDIVSRADGSGVSEEIVKNFDLVFRVLGMWM